MSKLTPIAGSNNRVIIKVDNVETTTTSGIIIPDSASEKPSTGIVYYVSEQDSNGVKPKVKGNDKVLFSKYSGTEFTIDGNEFLVLKESDILLIIK